MASPGQNVARKERETRYVFLHDIAQGAMGKVALLYDRARSRRVAAKRALVPSPAALLRLKREFRLIAPLRHPNLLKLYELAEDERGPFFTMEFIDGHDLAEVIDRALPDERLLLAQRVAVDGLSALRALHERGLVHRDVKPSNFMLTRSGAVKLLDFGLVTVPNGHARQGFGLDRRSAGTPKYMAPEQARGEPATAASDLYSLGFIVSELAGRARNAGQLGVLCDALLEVDPRMRPDAALALRMMGTVGVAPHPPADAERGGAEAPVDWILRQLDSVQYGGFGALVVQGPKGPGQGPVLPACRRRLEEMGGLVFSAGRRRREMIAFGALDTAMDELAEVLLDVPMDPELAADVALASTAFPVLSGPRADMPTVARQTAFDATIRLLASLAGAEGLYLLIEDIDRADAESLALVARLLEARPRGIGLVATASADAHATRHDHWLDPLTEVARFGPLSIGRARLP